VDASGVKELPNKFAAFGPVIGQALVGPLARDQHAAPGDAEVVGLVGFALAASRGHGVSDTLGLDPIQQPYRTARRARSDLKFGV
jgi:hypothetical protein